MELKIFCKNTIKTQNNKFCKIILIYTIYLDVSVIITFTKQSLYKNKYRKAEMSMKEAAHFQNITIPLHITHISRIVKFSIYHNHHHVPEGLGVFPVP